MLQPQRFDADTQIKATPLRLQNFYSVYFFNFYCKSIHPSIHQITSKSNEWFIEDQAFSPSYDLAPLPPYRQHFISLPES
jgi:hypothetical protein